MNDTQRSEGAVGEAAKAFLLEIAAEGPILPPAVRELAELASQPAAERTAQLIQLADHDPDLRAHLHHVAQRKPTYAGDEELSTPGAIRLLGIDQAHAVALQAAVRRILDTVDVVDAVFMQHNQMVGLAARCVATHVATDLADGQAYVAGFLHDIGQLVMRARARTRYNAVLQSLFDRTGNKEFVAAEKRIFGFTHDELGFELLRDAGLPELIVEGVLGHLDPDKTSISKRGRRMAAVVAVADWLSGQLGFGEVPAQLEHRSRVTAPIECRGSALLGLKGHDCSELFNAFWRLCDEWDFILN